MKVNLTRQDRITIAAIYTIPIVVLGAALFMAFEHAAKWHQRVSDPSRWEQWAFAIMIELPALMGLLLMHILPKVAPGKKPTIPRVLFATSAVISLAIQQAYAGSDASMSERITAGLPSLVAGIFVEILFWVIGLIDEAKHEADKEAAEAARKDVHQRVGLGDIAPLPDLTSPPPTPDTTLTWTPTPPQVRSDMSARRAPDIRPDAQGDMTPTPEVNVRQTLTLTSPDIPQVMPTGRADMSGSRPWDDLPDIDPDAEDAELVVALPDVRSDDLADTDTGSPDTAPDVRSTPDTDTEPDMTRRMSDPRWAEAAEMRRNGATVKAVARHFNVTDRTVGRWKLPAPESTKPVNGKTPHLTGADR